MSVWGKRVDSWFNQKTGAADTSREDYDRAGIRWLLITIGFAVVILLVVLLTRADSGF